MIPVDITHNEMAKSHARYLIGGRSSVMHFSLNFFWITKPNSNQSIKKKKGNR